MVARPSKWGNPFVLGERINSDDPRWPHLTLPTDPPDRFRWFSSVSIIDRQRAVDVFAFWLYEQPHLMCALDELSGRDLGCWCPPGQPCHADVLLELANQ